MSSMWDGLFESTSLNTDPKSAPKAVTVAPAAQTAPATEPKPKRTRTRATPTTIPATEAPADPAVDASIFFGADDTEQAGQAGATATAIATLTQEEDDDDIETDLFGEDTTPAEAPTPSVETPAPAPAPAPVESPVPEAEKPKAKSRGRSAGTKKKTVTAEQFAADMAKVEKGEPVSTGATFPEPSSSGQVAADTVEQDVKEGTQSPAFSLSSEQEALVRATVRIFLEEVAAFFGRRS